MKCVYDYGCESPVRLFIVTPWLSWRILLKIRICIHVGMRREFHCAIDLCD